MTVLPRSPDNDRDKLSEVTRTRGSPFMFKRFEEASSRRRSNELLASLELSPSCVFLYCMNLLFVIFLWHRSCVFCTNISARSKSFGV